MPNVRNIWADAASERTLNGSSLLHIVCFEFYLLTKHLIKDVTIVDKVDTLSTTIRITT